jgi:ribosomal protein S12 methylthiotransferase accessory factor
MGNVRLSPFVSIIPARSGVFVRSDVKSFALSGGSVGDFLKRALPLLDGEHDIEQIIAAFSDYSRKSVLALLIHLNSLGIVQPVDPSRHGPSADRREELSAYLTLWTRDDRNLKDRLQSAHVAIVGSSPWASTAGRQLLRAGVHALTWLEVPGHKPPPPRFERRKVSIEDGALAPLPPDLSLLLVAAHPDELRLLDLVARTAEKTRTSYLVAQVDGLHALVGPVVIPGETACWECLRSRRLANQADFEETARLHSALRTCVRIDRRSLPPPGASSLLAGLVMMECIRLLSGYAPSQLVGRQLEIDLLTYASRLHDLIMLPWCAVCGGAAARSESASPAIEDRDHGLASSRDAADLRARLAGWVDERLGVVRHLVLNDPTPEQPPSLETAAAVVAGPAVPVGDHHHTEPVIGSGKGTTKVAAMIGAVGEAIERYSASIYRERDLMRASASALGPLAFDPASLCLYRPEQYAEKGFPYDPFDPMRELSWADGRWLDTGEPVRIPALVTYFNYVPRQGERLCQATSNGLAAGATFEDAALRATLELIERDAFMMTWLQRRAPTPYAPGEELGQDVMEVLSDLRDFGMDVGLYLLPGDVKVPAFMGIAWGDGKSRPAATVALAASCDPIESARKAILELAHVNPYITRLMHDSSQRKPCAASEVRTLNDHALFYVPPRRLKAFDFIRSARSRPLPVSRIKPRRSSGIEACNEALAAAGHRVAVADVTAPDVRLGPFRVARAVGTYLQPIDFGHHQRRLANPRLGASINADPHPLA